MDTELPQPVPIRRSVVVGHRCPFCHDVVDRVRRWTTYLADETGATATPLAPDQTSSQFVPCGCEHVHEHNAPDA